MAGEAIVSVIVEKFADLLIQEASFLYGVKDQVKWIHRELKRMQCFLRDADEKQEVDERIKNWVFEIRDAAYDAEDVVDTYIFKKAQRKQRKARARYVSFIVDLIEHYKMGKQIENIKIKIREISESRSAFGLQTLGSVAEGDGYYFARERMKEKRRSCPYSDDSDLFGLDEDLRTLEAWMIDDSKLQRSIVSIVGMGGLGKTTLAKKIYNRRAVTSQFDCRAWVYVSQVYTVKDLLQDTWSAVTGLSGEGLRISELEKKLYEFLSERRYLIVMDDVWTSDVWENVKVVFPDTKKGSRIMFTTRNRDVALRADPRSLLHQPRLLSDDDSWNLFLKKIFITGENNICPPNLEVIGKQIVKKCGGLPLAIVVMGGLLSRKDVNYSVWLRVLERISWQLNQDETRCSQILALSYNDLPYYLKRCFIYMGQFPEDYKISVGRLIRLWVAEGLVEKRGNELLEDIARDYVEELIDRSMIQASQLSFNGKVKNCRMHDLLRDLSLLKANEAGVLHDGGNLEDACPIGCRPRRYVAHSLSCRNTRSLQHLHSFLCFITSRTDEIGKFLERGMHNGGFGLLRVLDLQGLFYPLIPDALGELIHLRYLGLRNTAASKLPSSLSKLRNLQTLDLKRSKISISDCAIWQLQQLRHIYLLGDWSSTITSPSSSRSSCNPNSSSLAQLQTLWGVYIAKENGVKGVLENSTKIRKLKVHGDLMSQGDSLAKWLVKLDCLEILTLKPSTELGLEYRLPTLRPFSNSKHLWKLHLEGQITGNLLGSHEFPPNLTTLVLDWCHLEEDPMRILEKLQSLRTLILSCKSYTGNKMLCSSGGFPHLQELKLDRLEELEEWTVEEGAMRNLEALEIHACEQLYMLPNELRHISSLRKLNLESMPDRFIRRVQANIGSDGHWRQIA